MAIYVNGKLVAGGGTSGSGGNINPDDIKDLVTMNGSGKIRLVGEFDDSTPYDIEFRSEDEDPGDGLPTGGTTGQILAKKSNNDYDTQWVTPSGGGTGGSSSANGITYDNSESGASGTNVQEAIDELFQSGSEGKALIASAITSKGVITEADASFEQMKENIDKISIIEGALITVTITNNSKLILSTNIYQFWKKDVSSQIDYWNLIQIDPGTTQSFKMIPGQLYFNSDGSLENYLNQGRLSVTADTSNAIQGMTGTYVDTNYYLNNYGEYLYINKIHFSCIKDCSITIS